MAQMFSLQHPSTAEERFFDKVLPEPNSGCWLWMAAVIDDSRGPKYIRGYFFFEGRPQVASRASYRMFRGIIPDGMYVLHRCDVPLCVNPDHLWLGTKADNSQDMARKRRSFYHEHPRLSQKRLIQGCNAMGYAHLQGASNHAAKLSPEQVREIRKLHGEGQRIGALAAQFGLHRHSISNIVKGRTWNGQA